MCDYSNDDLKQLLNVFSEVEYLKLSIQKTSQMHNEISGLMKNVTNKNLLFFLSLFNKVLVKEQTAYEEHLKQHSSTEAFEFPKIFIFDSSNNDEQNLANFVTQYDIYITVSTILVESYKSCDSFKEDIIKIHEMASDSTIIDRLNNIEITAESSPAHVAPEPATPEPAPTVPEPATPEPATPEPASTVPEPAPTVPEPAPTVPEPAPTVPEPAPTVPEPAPTVPDPSLPEPNAEKKEFKYSLEIYKHMTDSAQPMMSVDEVKDVLMSKLDEFKSICDVLQGKKNEIQECKTTLEEFKKKGMNVDSAILPLDEQHNEIDTQWKLNVNSLVEMKDKVVELVDAMNKDVEKYRPEQKDTDAPKEPEAGNAEPQV